MRHLRIFTSMLPIFLCSVIAAAHAGSVSGRVLLNGSNAPVAQAIVDFEGPQRARAVTIDDGTFYIPNLAPGTYTVTITYQGNVKRSFSSSVSAGASFTFHIDP